MGKIKTVLGSCINYKREKDSCSFHGTTIFGCSIQCVGYSVVKKSAEKSFTLAQIREKLTGKVSANMLNLIIWRLK